MLQNCLKVFFMYWRCLGYEKISDKIIIKLVQNRWCFSQFTNYNRYNYISVNFWSSGYLVVMEYNKICRVAKIINLRKAHWAHNKQYIADNKCYRSDKIV